MKYKHLSVVEREKIQELLWQKASIRSIALVLGRSPSSVLREINRNLPPLRPRYTPRLAEARALIKRKSRGRTPRLKNDTIRAYVTRHLKEGWSPEQISGRLRLDLNERVSHEAIYQYVYAQVHRNGWGLPRPLHEDLRPYLRRRRKRRMKKGTRRCQRIFRPKGISIEERPSIVDAKIRIGDFEGDSVESIDHKPGVNTLLERKTGMYFITKLESKKCVATTRAVVARLETIPTHLKRTLTLDNGSENSGWREIEKIVNISCYFAHPYSSWERGGNENANGLLREYFPKKTDFSMISDDELAAVEYRLNTRPRKRLGFKTPLEVWSVALQG